MDEPPTIVASWIKYFVSTMTTLKATSASTSLLEAMQRPQASSIPKIWSLSVLDRSRGKMDLIYYPLKMEK